MPLLVIHDLPFRFSTLLTSPQSVFVGYIIMGECLGIQGKKDVDYRKVEGSETFFNQIQIQI